MMTIEHHPHLPPEVQSLVEALVLVETTSLHLVACITDAAERLKTHAGPRSLDWPERKPERDRRAAKRRASGGVGDTPPPFDGETPWSQLLIEMSNAYAAWRAALGRAIQLAPGVGPLMDAGEPCESERWSVKLTLELRSLAGQLDPGRVGEDGLGIVRCGRPSLPDGFERYYDLIQDRRLTLLDRTSKSVLPDWSPRLDEPLKRLWDGLHDVYQSAQHVYGKWQQLEQKRSGAPGGEWPGGLFEQWAGLPEHVADRASLWRHIQARRSERRLGPESIPSSWFDGLDELAFLVRRLRAHLDRTLPAVDGVSSLDELNVLNRERWVYEVRKALMRLGGEIPRHDRDLPRDLGKGRSRDWEEAWRSIESSINDLRALPAASKRRAPAETGSAEAAADRPAGPGRVRVRRWSEVIPPNLPVLQRGSRGPVDDFVEAEPPTCGKAVHRFLNAASCVLSEHATGLLKDVDGTSEYPSQPAAHARAMVQTLVKIEMPAMLHAALLLARDEAFRDTIDRELRPMLVLANQLMSQLDGVPAERFFSAREPGQSGMQIQPGPWKPLHESLVAAVDGARLGWAAKLLCDETDAHELPAGNSERPTGAAASPSGDEKVAQGRWTIKRLCEVACIKWGTFDAIRKAAGVRVFLRGQHSQGYTDDELRKLVESAERINGKQKWKRAAAVWNDSLPPSQRKKIRI